MKRLKIKSGSRNHLWLRPCFKKNPLCLILSWQVLKEAGALVWTASVDFPFFLGKKCEMVIIKSQRLMQDPRQAQIIARGSS
jgi:hypothetical protein